MAEPRSSAGWPEKSIPTSATTPAKPTTSPSTTIGPGRSQRRPKTATRSGTLEMMIAVSEEGTYSSAIGIRVKGSAM